jgi:branched-chain amino acid aminotransferase
MKFETKYIWLDGGFVPWEKAKVHVLTHALHYGTGIFEGIRCYMTPKGPALFRMKEHIDRFFSGMKALSMPKKISKLVLKKAILELIRKNKLTDCYIRPYAFYGYGRIGPDPVGSTVSIALIAVPLKDYLPSRQIKVKTAPFQRINSTATVPGQKISGMYFNAALASMWAHRNNADEALMIDSKGYVAEGAAENLFCVKNGMLITPESSDILEGITRNSIIKMVTDLGLKIQVKKMRIADILKMDEAFFTGTAVEIHPIGKVNGKNIGNGKTGSITELIRQEYGRLVHGGIKKYRKWLTLVGL